MENSANKRTFGKTGEELAAEFLKRKGFQILHMNWFYKHKEIDIIARDGDFLVMVEVKTRNINFLESPGEMISRRKQSFLIRAAEAYVRYHNIEAETRFDVVIVVFDNQRPVIEHIDNAFQPGII